MKSAIAILSLILAGTVHAAPIEDNSFMIEEAHNQEEGVIQHILYYEGHEDSAANATFTEEVPLGSQTHQGSIAIPYEELPNPSDEKGIGDVELGYRYQLIKTENLAMAPKIGLVLPTGDYKDGLGTGATGINFLIPVSIKISDKYVSHLNVGYGFTPDAKNEVSDKADIHEAIFGTSLIYLHSDILNFMAEFYGEYGEEVISDDVSEGGTELWFNPGLRYAFNMEGGQLVVGAAYMNGVGPTAGETGYSLYLSFEH